ncbi:MAG: MarR family transcriptional regulator [Methyloceanibacter sp.]|nr:MarR family transcriptional regulator [Methyloceanibacter sp.]
MTDLNTPLSRGRKNPGKKRADTRADGTVVANDEKTEDSGAIADANLHTFAELLFFAYRDFTGDPDAILADFGFGRAHHRVLHFVNRNPGLRVADLLDILNITKQSLSRVLKQLIDQGYVSQKAGASDRRERLLYPTEQGKALAARLAAPQMVRLRAALETAGPDGETAIRRFLEAMINAEDRPKVSAITNRETQTQAQARNDKGNLS